MNTNLSKYAGQVITVEVSILKIAEQLKASFKEDNPHADMLTETLMDIAINSKNVGLVYNNLQGFTNKLDFEIGQEVVCSSKAYKYENPEATRTNYMAIGVCTIIDIDLTKKDDVLVQFNKGTETEGSNGYQLETAWVEHKTLSLAIV